MALEYLQNYWWFLISLLGAILVFMLFVQGGQTILFTTSNVEYKTLIANSMGRKWELTFTTLVVFGGAFFASFPLFYSVSFGSVYWLWMSILISFVLQAVSYEFRNKKGNLFGTAVYDFFLFLNGFAGCLLLGVAVSMFFFGTEFVVDRQRLLDTQNPIISYREVHYYGYNAIFYIKNLILGFAILFLARMHAAMYMLSNVSHDGGFKNKMKKQVKVNGLLFVLMFVVFMIYLLSAKGIIYFYDNAGAVHFDYERCCYLQNYCKMWWTAVMLLSGVALVLFAIYKVLLTDKIKNAIWFSCIGTLLVVMSLFFVAGYNNTAYYPSLIFEDNSLTIRNSSSSQFTLMIMSIVSLIIPFVAAYIIYVWRSMDKKKTILKDLNSTEHKY